MASLAAGVVGVGLGASGGFAQGGNPSVWESGHEFVTVGAAGNRDALREEWPIFYDTSADQAVGGVNYAYRITRSEVAASQWIAFAEAFRPFKGDLAEYELEAGVLSWTGETYRSNPTRGAQPSFQLAARYCNWLHNGRVNESWAFASGAYDVGLFEPLPDGTYQAQSTRLPGARYWIPSFDESIKAIYFDPNRYGPGEAGYWPYVNMSLAMPIPGVTTNAGTDDSLGFGLGLYPSAQSPWGLLDTSGGVSEMTESFHPLGNTTLQRRSLGSSYGDGFFDVKDRLDSRHGMYDQRWGSHGFRVASVVPTPGSAANVVTACLFISRRRNAKRVDMKS